MKKILVLLVIFLISILLSGCNNQNTTITMMSYEIDEYEVNNYFDASMLIVNDSITNKGLSLELNYYGKDEGITGLWYTILFYEDNQWNELPYVVDGDVGWELPGYPVEKNHPYEMSIDWEWLYGELSAGRYLIVKKIINHCDSAGDNDNYYLACEFTI